MPCRKDRSPAYRFLPKSFCRGRAGHNRQSRYAVSKLLRGEISDSTTVPIPLATGPIYWRNGFERRFINYKTTKGQMVTALANIDVCIPNGDVQAYVGIDDMNFFDIAEDPYNDGYASTGEYSLNIDGYAKPNDGSSVFQYKLAETNIDVKDDMILQYNLRPETELGGHVYIDLVFSNGKKLSDVNGGAVAKAERGTVGEWSNVIFKIPSSLKGTKITSVIATYDYAYPGEFNAYIDDVIIKDVEYNSDSLFSLISDAQSLISGIRSNYFTSNSVSALKSAIDVAKDANSNSAIINAYNSLVEAMNALVAVPREIPAEGNAINDDVKTDKPLPEETNKTEVTADSESKNIEQIENDYISSETTPPVKKIIKKVIKPSDDNYTTWIIILSAVVILAVGLLAMMFVAAKKRNKLNLVKQ